ncbi:hypothetical protein [uncultured Cetobacterium sp.]|uniref:hypothetical protein n=1 Tax=uncultured Cetobacterium sp. TaxID=527638 RepID=UPI00261DB68E|nr:hypothetical protein [uncultured Cetobacterium sp.]
MITFIDGGTASGKTTLANKLNGIHITENKYLSKKHDFLDRQFDFTSQRLKELYFLKNEIYNIDTSLLSLISFTLFSKENTKEDKKIFLDRLIKMPENSIKIDKIIYLFALKKVLYERKDKDSSRERNSFKNNILHLDKEIKLYILLSSIYPESFLIIDTSKPMKEKIKMIDIFKGKSLFLNDILKTIRKLIK